jgi:hypothetical protein
VNASHHVATGIERCLHRHRILECLPPVEIGPDGRAVLPPDARHAWEADFYEAVLDLAEIVRGGERPIDQQMSEPELVARGVALAIDALQKRWSDDDPPPPHAPTEHDLWKAKLFVRLVTLERELAGAVFEGAAACA